MDTSPLDAPFVIALLILLTLLIASASLWIRHVQCPRELINSDKGVASWSTGWINFGILISVIITVVTIVQTVAFRLLFDERPTESYELTPEIPIAGILTHGSMLAAFLLLSRFYPNQFALRLNEVKLSIGDILKQSFVLFVKLLPVVWISGLIWSLILGALRFAGIIEELKPQELVTMYLGGGDWVATMLFLFVAVCVAPIVEEVIFRGCFYRFLKSKTTIFGAQIISGTIFALMHHSLLAFVPLTVVGILLARVYEKTGNLYVAIWFHAFFNALALMIASLKVLSSHPSF